MIREIIPRDCYHRSSFGFVSLLTSDFHTKKQQSETRNEMAVWFSTVGKSNPPKLGPMPNKRRPVPGLRKE